MTADGAGRTGVGVGRAHAKAILFGEHAVVHGRPALAVPLHALAAEVVAVTGEDRLQLDTSLYAGPAATAPPALDPVIAAATAAIEHFGLRPGLRVAVHSAIPHGRGLGSSAAVAAAVAEAVAALAGRVLDPDARHEIVQAAERVAHGNPSGLDARSVVADGPIRFRAGDVAPVAVGAPLSLVLADSGRAGSTATAVAEVRRRLVTEPRAADAVLDRLGELADRAAGQLAAGAAEDLGRGMVEAHALLAGLGVSTPELDGLVTAALAAGALGAKLTGGGLGGCILALAPGAAAAEDLAHALLRAGATQTWTTRIDAT